MTPGQVPEKNQLKYFVYFIKFWWEQSVILLQRKTGKRGRNGEEAD